MSTEIGEPLTVISPRTGEVIRLDAPSEELGGYLQDVREHESMLKEAKLLVQREIVRRMDRQAKWTIHGPGMKMTAPSPKPAEEWDGAELRAQLLALVDESVLAIEAVDAAVEVVVEHKVHKAGINALRSLGGRPKEIVDGLAQKPEKERYVSVTRP